MMGINNSSSLFRRKVRNQVLKSNRKNDYFLKYYDFDEMRHSDYTPLDDFCTTRRKKNGSTNLTAYFVGPRDYYWDGITECCFIDHTDCEYDRTILALPHNWLHHYDPTIPIFKKKGWYHTCYLDLEKQKWVSSVAYLIRDRFHLYEIVHICNPGPKDPRPYSIRKGDKDWCITHLNIHPSCMINSYFRSFLLLKNIDFSEFDARVKAKGLKCPVRYHRSIKLKDNPQIRIVTNSYYTDQETICICIDCRKDYRAFEVSVQVFETRITLDFFYLIK